MAVTTGELDQVADGGPKANLPVARLRDIVASQRDDAGTQRPALFKGLGDSCAGTNGLAQETDIKCQLAVGYFLTRQYLDQLFLATRRVNCRDR